MTRWLYLSIALTLAALGGSLYVYFFLYDRLAPQIPIHWNIQGMPDGYMPKENVLTFLFVPALMALMVGLTLLLPWISPRQFEVDTFRDTWDYVMMLVVALVGYVLVIMLGSSLQQELHMGRWLVGGILLFLALSGNVLGRVRRNFWMGVRTPWALANEHVWVQTHRLAAWLFVGASVVGLVAVLAGLPLWWCFIGIIIAVLAPALYSLVLYKRLEKQGKL
jgi:uncharacterized membrane protein